MFWFLDLPWSNPEDWWLNVLAGVPFLVFDILIIVWLLPRAIEWRNDLRWQQSRLRAINHILSSYRDVLRSCEKAVDDAEWLTPSDPLRIKLVHAALSRLQEVLVAGTRSMDTEIQTALPILGPQLSEEILAFHYSWRERSREIAGYLGDLRTVDDKPPSEDRPSAGYVREHVRKTLGRTLEDLDGLGWDLRRARLRYSETLGVAMAHSSYPRLDSDVIAAFVEKAHAYLFDPKITPDEVSELAIRAGTLRHEGLKFTGRREKAFLYANRQWWNRLWGDDHCLMYTYMNEVMEGPFYPSHIVEHLREKWRARRNKE